ncbi:MAG: pyruvate dehydrogenase complex dihydrolipoamide acetyltransferase [Verrucomicrobia bacterium]|jgi:pyruvate dehydrogenase E2 component (dihydrolipoamide acetyltransferase)|nr:MAG: pyruvate dehydrogenase complex dihydrolipoamide acetyltransferase [Verrucomicrobiota bacterium]PYK44891.1 MAG: pyruvate dehydrogenase complex dihydrolipoamide acetyltransferase [Verrucomicrobiota bacterium]
MPEIQMPKLSDTMSEGTLVAWKKKKGDQVSAGEVLAEIETDKATMEWESPEDGTLADIYVQEGGKVNVGDKIAFIRGEGEEAPAQEASAQKKGKEPDSAGEKKNKPQAETEKPAPARAEQEEIAPPQQKRGEGAVSAALDEEKQQKPEPIGREHEQPRVKASPVARRIASELGVDLFSVKGTGPEGRVTETDVRAAAKSQPVAAGVSPAGKQPARLPLQAGESARIQLSGMRKIIAQRLVESLGPVPHFYLTIEINAGPLMEAREELKSAGEGADAAKITVNDFVLKAAVMAAVKVPRVNASFDKESIVQYADVDLGVAVAIEDGLLTPVIRDAQDKSLREISALAKDLAHRARNKRMKPEEFQGGTFTISNLGGMGIDSFSAVINPPQGFILAVGKITKVPVIDDCDQLVVGHRMSITMSCDHRVIDGALGAEYLKELRHLLENPALLMV